MKKQFLLIISLFFCLLASAQDKMIYHPKISYGPDPKQWLNVYQAKSDKPTPLYIWAHANSDGKTPPTANMYPKELKIMLSDAGISAISWGSICQQAKSAEDIIQAQNDLELVYQWVVENAEKYNFDLNNVFLGGRSRGTIASWKFLHTHPDKIKGAYMTQAVPKGAWGDPKNDPRDLITKNSPKIVLSYREGLETTDNHTPVYGIRIAEKYKQLGIGDRAQVYYSMGDDMNKYIVPFIWENSK